MVSKSKKLYPFNFLRLYVLFITYLKISVTFFPKKCMKWAKISILSKFAFSRVQYWHFLENSHSVPNEIVSFHTNAEQNGVVKDLCVISMEVFVRTSHLSRMAFHYTLRTIVNRLYTDVNHSSANPVAPPRFWHLTNTRIIGTDQLLLYYCITYTLKHYGWWSSGGLVVGVLGFQ